MLDVEGVLIFVFFVKYRVELFIDRRVVRVRVLRREGSSMENIE